MILNNKIHFCEMSLAFQFFLFVELLYIVHYSMKLCKRKKPFQTFNA